jgi:hypothetical protein
MRFRPCIHPSARLYEYGSWLEPSAGHIRLLLPSWTGSRPFVAIAPGQTHRPDRIAIDPLPTGPTRGPPGGGSRVSAHSEERRISRLTPRDMALGHGIRTPAPRLKGDLLCRAQRFRGNDRQSHHDAHRAPLSASTPVSPQPCGAAGPTGVHAEECPTVADHCEKRLWTASKLNNRKRIDFLHPPSHCNTKAYGD